MMTFMEPPSPIMGRAELPSTFLAEQIMSMPAVRPHRWTVLDVERLIAARAELAPRYELVDGELLVTPAPTSRHQRMILRLAFIMQPYLVRHAVGELRLGPGGLKLREQDHYEPDLFIIPLVDGRLAPDAYPVRPLLVCEVLSPSSSRHDRITKRRAFQAAGVPEYWVVDGDAEAFEIWHQDDERPAIIDDRVVWRPSPSTEPLELDVRHFFASVADGAELA